MPYTAEDFLAGQVLLIDKPLNWTSFDVVNFLRSFIRKVYGLTKLKVGHAGTLDPLATGLLIICTGKKTKEIEAYQGMEKVYVGSMQLGATTPSFDKETEPDEFFDFKHLEKEEIIKVPEQFIGEIEQIPPIFSAVKIEGKRAFEYARKQTDVQVKSRKVVIHEFSLLNVDIPDIDFSVTCSKGTYIRSLVNDFGKALNSGAYLTALRRTQIGNFKVNDAYTIDSFKHMLLNQHVD